jgi:hypothetical protein
MENCQNSAGWASWLREILMKSKKGLGTLEKLFLMVILKIILSF